MKQILLDESSTMENIVVVDRKAEEDCLSELRSYVSNSPDLLPFNAFLDDKFLLHFVRGKKYCAAKAIQSLSNYMDVRKNKYNSVFKTLTPSTNSCLRSGSLRILKNRDKAGRVIAIWQLSHYDTSNISADDVVKAFILLAEEMWNSEQVELQGCVVIVDLSGMAFSHLRQWKNPARCLKLIDLFFNNMPIRYKGFHLVNNNFIFMLLLKAVYHVLPKKLRDQLFYYTQGEKGLAKFHADISPEILPKCLGGKLSEDEAWDSEFEQRILSKDGYYKIFSELI